MKDKDNDLEEMANEVLDVAKRANPYKEDINTEYNIVKEPDHYKHGTFEVIDEMIIIFGIENTITFCLMNAWKYRARALYKGNFKQDMDKANNYLEMAHDLQKKKISGEGYNLLKYCEVEKTNGHN